MVQRVFRDGHRRREVLPQEVTVVLLFLVRKVGKVTRGQGDVRDVDLLWDGERLGVGGVVLGAGGGGGGDTGLVRILFKSLFLCVHVSVCVCV